MNHKEIQALIEERNEWCVSVIIPTHRTSPDRRVNSEILKKSVIHARTLLDKKKPPIDTYNLMVKSIDKLLDEFDPVHALDGLGIYVSPDITQMVHFPFPVKEKIIIDKSFETRDLHYFKQFSSPYYILKLTKNQASLFLNDGTQIREITNTHFPMSVVNDYAYARSTLGTSFGYARKGFEKDKSVIGKLRLEPFYRGIHQNLKQNIKAGNLLINGSKKVITDFEAAGDRTLRIKGRIIGIYKNKVELFERARATYYDAMQNEIQSMIDSLEELPGTRKTAIGIREVWSTAVAGKGNVLLVEKDFRKTGYTLEDGKQISLQVPAASHTTLPDVVDQVIETVIDKGGRVVFTEDNQLEKYEHIALILRY